MSGEGERRSVLRRNLLRGIGGGSLGVSTVATIEVVGASGGDERLLTANHLWETCQDNSGRTLKQHTDAFGEVDECDTNTDYALVKPTSSEGIDKQVMYVDGGSKRVGGYVPKEGVDDLVTSDETCYNTGATTCTTEGTIEGTGLSSPGYQCIDYEDNGVKADIVAGDGDSGGPIFTIKSDDGNEYASIIAHYSSFNSDGSVSCHWGSGEKGSPIYGTAFYHLKSDYGLNIC